MDEKKLYPDIADWLRIYLKDKYSHYNIETTFETSQYSLDVVLRKKNIVIKETVGLSLKIDIVGILRRGKNIKLAFVEVKNKPLTLKDLGQLWGYTQLINPIESFLISPKGLGALDYIFNVLRREDLLVYGKKANRIMKVAKWDVSRKMIDYLTLVPKR